MTWAILSRAPRYSTVLMANIGTQLLHVALQMEMPRWGSHKQRFMVLSWWFTNPMTKQKCWFHDEFFMLVEWFLFFFFLWDLPSKFTIQIISHRPCQLEALDVRDSTPTFSPAPSLSVNPTAWKTKRGRISQIRPINMSSGYNPKL